MTDALYVIKLPVNKATALQALLQQLGVELDVSKDMVLTPDEPLRQQHPLLFGTSVPQTLSSINHFLNQQQISPKPGGDYVSWSPETTAEFLIMAAKEFHADRHGTTTALTDQRPNHWKTVVSQHPSLFPQHFSNQEP